MPTGRESALWGDLKRLKLPYAERIETATIGNGFPDTHLMIREGNLELVSWFVEMKRVKIVRGRFVSLAPIRPDQIRWHYRFSMKSDRSCFLLGTPDGEKYLLASCHVIALANKQISPIFASLVKEWTTSQFVEQLLSLNRGYHHGNRLVGTEDNTELREECGESD